MTDMRTCQSGRRRRRAPMAVLIGAIVICAASASGQMANPGFETGDYADWTTTGTAWGAGPKDSHPHASGWNGSWFAETFTAGESAVGTLRSSPFVIDNEQLNFLIGGWREWPGEGQNWNWVVLRDAATDAEVTDRIYPLQANAMTELNVDVRPLAGQEVYVEVVDNADGGGYAWICVDHFTLSERSVGTPGGINGNGNFELTDFTAWTTSGAGWGTAPVKTNGVTAGREQFYFADTYHSGETAMGTLTSDAFTIGATDTVLGFRIAGWTAWEGTLPSKSFVYLRSAADDAILEEAVPPNGNNFVRRFIDVSAYQGQQVYIECVDGNDESGYAWFSVDDFRLYEQMPYIGSDKVEVAPLPGPPVVDGNPDDAVWGLAREYRAGDLIGSAEPADDADLSAVFRMAYHGDALYLLAIVTDDQDDLSGPSAWERDSVEVYLDLSRVGGPLPDDAGHPAAWENQGGPVQMRFRYDGQDAQFYSAGVLTSNHAVYAVNNQTPGQTVYEIQFLPPQSLDLSTLDSFGFGLAVNDADDGALGAVIGWWGGPERGTGYNPAPSGIPAMWQDAWSFAEAGVTAPLDSDGDGLPDDYEASIGTDAFDPDTDGDGLDDGDEVLLGTDPLDADSDGDGYSDGDEVAAGTNPLDPRFYPGVMLPTASVWAVWALALALLGAAAAGIRRSRTTVR